MKRANILSFTEAKRCMGCAARYPIASRNALVTCLTGMVIAILSWFTLAALPAANWTFWGILAAYLSGMMSLLGSALRTTELSFFWMRSGAYLFFALVAGLNLLGEPLELLSALFDGNVLSAALRGVLFRSLSDFILLNGLLCLLPYPFWLGLSFLDVKAFRSEQEVTTGFAVRMMANWPVLLLQMFVTGSISIALFMSAAWSYFAVVIAPMLLIWMGVYVFLIIYRIENGAEPCFVMKNIADMRK